MIMTDYGKGSVLGAAAFLPATSGLAIALINNLDQWVLVGFVLLNVVWFVFMAAHISRFIFNRKTA